MVSGAVSLRLSEVSQAGEGIGINTAIADQVEGIGFAVAISSARPVIDDMAAHGKAMNPWLGVSIITVTPVLASQYGLSVTEGALVAQVVSGSPADHAGLKSGDVIVGIDG